MGKAGRWLRSILAGKNRRREKALPQPQGDAVTPLPGTPNKEKKRWSFRRAVAPSSSATAAQGKPSAAALPSPLSQDPSARAGLGQSEREVDVQSEQAVDVAVAADDAEVVAAEEEAAAAARLTEAEEEERELLLARWLVEEAAAARIQATFRGYLARKALCALRGLVKLQALIRGQVVRRQANATLRRMQALVSAQSRLRAQQARMLENQDHQQQRRSPQHPRRRSSYEMDRSGEEHVKIVEMDGGDTTSRRGRSSFSAVAGDDWRDRRLAEYYYHYGNGQCSPAPSSFADLSPRTYSGYLDDLLPLDRNPYDDSTADLQLQGQGGFVPSYMANTESSRAKQARSQSAPRQRTHDALERQTSRRRGGGGAPAARKTMQRSSSHIGVPAVSAAAACGYQFQQYQYPAWAGVRLDRSSASLVGSECGSSSSVLTAATVGGGYGRSLVGFEVHNRGHY
ncbi:hypothetical protein QOZ80_2AG0125010 [Eleusine coracana subsp. coracana]|nr:hypothetical protein QOZ80_2AG0125010 [Eleusine coracana subsp. coracana]